MNSQGEVIEPDETAARMERLAYMRDMLGELAAMAAREKLDILAYLIEMAQLEVRETLSGTYVPRPFCSGQTRGRQRR